jgi:hypothetical protein
VRDCPEAPLQLLVPLPPPLPLFRREVLPPVPPEAAPEDAGGDGEDDDVEVTSAVAGASLRFPMESSSRMRSSRASRKEGKGRVQ